MAQTTIKVNKSVKANFRQGTARAAYYSAICKHNGKSLNGFIKACAAKPPSYPKAGKLKGKLEPTAGWVAYFVRTGHVTLA